MKKASLVKTLSLISSIDTPEAEEIRAEISAELAKGEAKAEANRAVYAEIHDKVIKALTDKVPVFCGDTLIYDVIDHRPEIFVIVVHGFYIACVCNVLEHTAKRDIPESFIGVRVLHAVGDLMKCRFHQRLTKRHVLIQNNLAFLCILSASQTLIRDRPKVFQVDLDAKLPLESIQGKQSF